MIAVLDASAAVELVLNPDRWAPTVAAVRDADWVLAPALYVAETTNTFWKYHRFGGLEAAVCAQALARCVALPDTYADDRELHVEAFGLACQARRPVYDLLYLVLARRHNAVLLTADRALARFAHTRGVATPAA